MKTVRLLADIGYFKKGNLVYASDTPRYRNGYSSGTCYYLIAPLHKKLCWLTSNCGRCNHYCKLLAKECDILNEDC